MTGEVWQARVFGSEGARGCSVAVVLPGAATPTSLSSLAQDLGADVTAFLLSGPDERATLISYTPTRKLSCSATALLAAEAVLRQRGRAHGNLEFVTPDGLARVQRVGGKAWAIPPSEDWKVGQPVAPLASVLGSAAPRGQYPEQVVVGPKRIYVRRLTSPAGLQLLNLPQAQAWAYLRHEGLDAICLFAFEESERTLSLRVFESALGGREAIASPAALPALCACLPESPDPITIHQGRGAPLRRATLRVRADAGGVAIRGEVRLLSQGQLLSARTSSERVA